MFRRISDIQLKFHPFRRSGLELDILTFEWPFKEKALPGPEYFSCSHSGWGLVPKGTGTSRFASMALFAMPVLREIEFQIRQISWTMPSTMEPNMKLNRCFCEGKSLLFSRNNSGKIWKFYRNRVCIENAVMHRNSLVTMLK